MDLLKACCDSRQILNEILEIIQDAIIVIDLKGRILFSSTVVETVLGFKPEELTGKDLSLLFTPEDLKHLYPNLLHLAQDKQPFHGELMLLKKDGSRFFASMSLKAFQDHEQDKAIIAACIQDHDEKKQMERAIRQSHYEDLVQIANGIAHEIRNPLMGIGGFINRLFNSDKTVQDYDKYHEYIIKNIQQIEDLVQKVEGFASVAAPRFSKTSIGNLIKSVLEPFLEKIHQQDIDIKLRLEKMDLLVDREQLMTVFSILIANALDALNTLSTGRELTITSETSSAKTRISIKDNGSGISPEDLDLIFRPFFSTKPDRVGIDLATAKRIMDNHGGSIEVTSEKDHGATFTLIFPIERRRPFRVSCFQQPGSGVTD